MTGQPNYFKIGLCIIAAFLLLAAALIYLGADRMLRPKIYLETYVDGTVQGIDIGSPVKFRGVQIGRISRIDFVFNEYGTEPKGSGRNDYVFLEMEIDRKLFRGMFTGDVESILNDAVKQGLRVMLQPQGITGLNFAELNYVAQPERAPPLRIWWTPSSHYIPSAPGTLTSMLDSVNRIMDRLGSTDVKGTIRDTELAMEAVATTMRKLEGELDHLELGETGAELRTLLADIKTKVDGFPAAELGEEGRRLLDSLGGVSKEMQTLVEKIENNPMLQRKAAQGIVSDLQATASNLRDLSESLRENPGQLIFGPRKKTAEKPRR